MYVVVVVDVGEDTVILNKPIKLGNDKTVRIADPNGDIYNVYVLNSFGPVLEVRFITVTKSGGMQPIKTIPIGAMVISHNPITPHFIYMNYIRGAYNMQIILTMKYYGKENYKLPDT